MLTKCPECELPVSDKAILCPHCGYPLKPEYTKKVARKKPKRQRLPNGFGQISELKGLNLRKPFRAMVTIGKTDKGKPICKLLQPEAYFETYNEAYMALMEYNRNPAIISNSITIGELYDRWFKARSTEWKEAVINSTKSAWRYCNSVKNIKVTELRPHHIRYCIEEAEVEIHGEVRTASPQFKRRIKTIFNKMLNYAVEYDIVDKNIARTFIVEKTLKDKEIEENSSKHIPYTDEEIKTLWENAEISPAARVILIQCYSGMRPKELEILEVENINIENRTMKTGVKTKAGINRIIPIHSKIYGLVKTQYEKALKVGSKYLFYREYAGKVIQYTRSCFLKDIEYAKRDLNISKEHRPHDGRAHFITQAKKYNVDEYAIKRIVGHSIKDITELIYTQRDIDWLVNEMEKIK